MKWWGVLTGHQWIMHGVGIVTDPTGRRPGRAPRGDLDDQDPAVAEAGAELERLELHVREGHGPPRATSPSRTASPSTRRSSSSATSASRTRPRSSRRPRRTSRTSTSASTSSSAAPAASARAANKINQAQIVGGCKAAASATSGAWTTPCTSRHPRQRDTILSGTIVGDAARSPTSPSGTRTRSRGRARRARRRPTGTPPAFEGSPAGGAEQQRRHDQPDAELELQLQVLRHPAEPDRPARRALVEQHDEEADGQGAIYIDGSAYISNNTRQRVRRAGDALPLRHVPDRRQRAALRRRRRRQLRLRRLGPEHRQPRHHRERQRRLRLQRPAPELGALPGQHLRDARRPRGELRRSTTGRWSRARSSSRTTSSRTSSRRSRRCRSAGRATRPSTPSRSRPQNYSG